MGATTKVERGTRDPRDSMKSTWRTDRSQWGPIHYLINFLNVYGKDLNRDIPVFAKTDPIPFLQEWASHRWILLHAAWPLLLHKALAMYLGQNLHPGWAYGLYVAAFQINSIHEIHVLRQIGHHIGYFDGDKHPRDEIPDHAVAKTFNSLQLTTTIRPLIAIFLSYRRSIQPQLSWWLPVEVGLYAIILDGWFYLYHRSCHELDGLWQYHRTHHLTKHPNPLLSSYADSEQEFLELAIIPLLTYVCLKLMGFPMGFYDWWICHQYLIFTEAFGHSGLRMFASSAGAANWLLRMTGCELTIEDHDLHHRKGWRNSYNYGKQTRLWDRLFGTCHERVEGDITMVDKNKAIAMPLFYYTPQFPMK